MGYRMKGFSGFGNSPAKDNPHTTTEDHKPHEKAEKKAENHPLMGSINDAGTKVINEKGDWVGVGDRPDLAPKKEIEKQIEIGKTAPPTKFIGQIDKALKGAHSIKGTADELTGKAHLNRAMNQPITTTASGGLSKKEEMGGGAR